MKAAAPRVLHWDRIGPFFGMRVPLGWQLGESPFPIADVNEAPNYQRKSLQSILSNFTTRASLFVSVG